MSHFTVLVLSKNTDIDPLLDPYDENEDDKEGPRWDLDAQTPQDHWYYGELLEKGEIEATITMEEYVKVYMRALLEKDGVDSLPIVVPSGSSAQVPDDDHDVWKIEDGALYSVTTYNRLSKWDYWRIGGRWSGRLKLKPGATALGEVESHWDGPESVEPGWCDQAYKRDIDIEGMRDAAGEKARAEYLRYRELADLHGVPDDAWLELDHNSDEFTTGRDAYWKHPLIVALREADLVGFMGPMPTKEFGLSLDEYVTRARMRALSGYSTLDGLRPNEEDGTPGTWMAKGEMGWWGLSTDTPDSELTYLQAVNKVIDDAPDDTVFTFIDCHI